RQLIGERAGEGESPSAFSLFVYRTHNEARQERHMNAPQSHIVSMITPLPLYRNAEQERRTNTIYKKVLPSSFTVSRNKI
ncbi:hypothetical protein, partial [Barnesiella intestinihominis]|uniref:hypothetical protein n=1 Tax=Barnesiella intestinihominis TaxID=487174 RepID=UPI003AB12178